jgi:hypothetical protein
VLPAVLSSGSGAHHERTVGHSHLLATAAGLRGASASKREHIMNTRSIQLRHAVVLAFCVACSVLATREASADAKLVPATVCQPLNQISQSTQENPDAVLARLTNIRYSYNGRVLNQSATDRYSVVCPILRDNLARRLNWIRVLYADQFPDPPMPSPDHREALECEVRAAHGLAEFASDSEPASTLDGFDVAGPLPGTGSGFFQFHLLDDVQSGADANNPNSIYHFSHYTLVCHIPPRSGNLFSWIAGIMIDEP